MTTDHTYLLDQYKELERERMRVDYVLSQHGTLDRAYEDSATIVSAQYYSYIVWLLVAIGILTLFVTCLSVTGFSTFSLWYIVVVCIIVLLNATLKGLYR